MKALATSLVVLWKSFAVLVFLACLALRWCARCAVPRALVVTKEVVEDWKVECQEENNMILFS